MSMSVETVRLAQSIARLRLEPFCLLQLRLSIRKARSSKIKSSPPKLLKKLLFVWCSWDKHSVKVFRLLGWRQPKTLTKILQQESSQPKLADFVFFSWRRNLRKKAIFKLPFAVEWPMLLIVIWLWVPFSVCLEPTIGRSMKKRKSNQ